MNRILGIDPALSVTGYGVVAQEGEHIKIIEAGTISTSIKQDLPTRLSSIYTQLSDLIKETKPLFCILEELYSHYKHPMTAILMGHARGIAVLAASLENLKLINYPAKTVKRAVTGNGNASKQQVRQAVENFLKMPHIAKRPADVTDALALCLTHIYHSRGNENKLKI
ncbi:MAG: crossover junction endodeoxyribonuclease RuvC [Candidatus Omnitrophota bacterium]